MTLDIVYVLNDRFWLPVLVSARSALLFNERSRLAFHLLVDGVTDSHRRVLSETLTTSCSSVEFVDVDMGTLEGYPDWKGSKLVWTRCRLNSWLPRLKGWVCICDGDVLWMQSPEKAFEIAFGQPAQTVVCGSEDLRGGGYFCLGFALVHLQRMEEFETDRKCQDFIRTRGIPRWFEQDIFNDIFADAKFILPAEWGCSAIEGLRKLRGRRPAAIHYFGALPWPSSWRRRMQDAHVLWWHLAWRLMGVSQKDPRFRMNWALFALMRLSHFAYAGCRASGLVRNGCLGIGPRLPLRTLCNEITRRYGADCSAAAVREVL